MRVVRSSQAFIPTLKETPADAEVASHKLLRPGRLHPPARGRHLQLPAAGASGRCSKIERIIREEMDAIGGQEFYLPALHPAEIWKESGRWEVHGRQDVPAEGPQAAATSAWA